MLVVGGSPAGVWQAVEQAESGNQVYLVEEGPTLSGSADRDLASRLAALGDRVQVITLADLESVERDGGFKVKLRKRPFRVDSELCDGCDDCVRVCPANIDDPYRSRMPLRTAIDSLTPGGRGYNILRQAPPCQEACPVHLDVRGYVGMAADGRHRDSLALIREKLPFPGIIGRICTRPCEAACNRSLADQPVAICALKRFVADKEIEEGVSPGARPEAKRAETSGKRVAVIGSGPAGLSCAYELAGMGHTVTVFEALPVLGGMLRVGIPEYRLPRKVLDAEVGVVERMGVRFETNARLGRDFTVDGLLQRGNDAVFIAVGAHRGQRLGIPGEDASGVLHGIDFLRDLNLGDQPAVGRQVVVVGGGNVAIDSARSALRLGAERVSVVYRRTRAEMTAHHSEVEAALEEGVDITYLAAPDRVVARDGRVKGVVCVRMELGGFDRSGRRAPAPVAGSQFTLEADTIIAAVGQSAEAGFLSEADGVKAQSGRVEVDSATLATTRPGVFSGGDAVTGPRSAIDAIAQGQQAAQSIDRYLKGGR